MKNYILVLVVLSFFIPTFVYAAWWNPLSWFDNWNFMRETNTKTQILENRVKELENKLETSSASKTTTDTSNFKPVSITPKAVPKKVSQTYNYIPIAFIDQEIKRINLNIEYAQGYSSHVSSIIQSTSERVQFVQNLNTVNDSFLSMLVQSDNGAIKHYSDVKSYLDKLIGISQTRLSSLKEKKLKLTAKLYTTEAETKDDSLSILKMGDEETAIANALIKQAEDFNKSYNEYESLYLAALAKERATNSAHSSSLSNFTLPTHTYSPPQLIQPVPMSQQTTCTISPIGGGGVDLIGHCY